MRPPALIQRSCWVQLSWWAHTWLYPPALTLAGLARPRLCRANPHACVWRNSRYVLSGTSAKAGPLIVYQRNLRRQCDEFLFGLRSTLCTAWRSVSHWNRSACQWHLSQCIKSRCGALGLAPVWATTSRRAHLRHHDGVRPAAQQARHSHDRNRRISPTTRHDRFGRGRPRKAVPPPRG